jgi:hypothetical protein
VFTRKVFSHEGKKEHAMRIGLLLVGGGQVTVEVEEGEVARVVRELGAGGVPWMKGVDPQTSRAYWTNLGQVVRWEELGG